jgi:hypothetical protein
VPGIHVLSAAARSVAEEAVEILNKDPTAHQEERGECQRIKCGIRLESDPDCVDPEAN